MENDADRVLRVIKVFLSSPSDVAEERNRAVLAVDEVNHASAHKLRFHIDILPWSAGIGPGTGVGMGRTQERINPLVREADLFVGIFWKRFGQPTGEYESGTEEEFNIVRRRWLEHGDPAGWPEIWMFFRDVDEALLDDPGPQLQKVLSFKRQVKEQHLCLYYQYKEPSQFERDFRILLTSFIVELSKGKRWLPSEAAVKGVRTLPEEPVRVTSKKQRPSEAIVREAARVVPCRFYGTVKVNGNWVPSGTLITASIDNAADTWVAGTFIVDGQSVYAVDVPADSPPLPKHGGRAGDVVRFKVLFGGSDYQAVQTGVWVPAKFVSVNLAIVS